MFMPITRPSRIYRKALRSTNFLYCLYYQRKYILRAMIAIVIDEEVVDTLVV